MTLDTTIYVKGAVDWRKLHAWVNAELLRAPDVRFRSSFVENQDYRSGSLSNEPGQGLDAWYHQVWWDRKQTLSSDVEDYVLEDYDSVEDFNMLVEEHLSTVALVGEYYGRLSFDTSYGFNSYGLGASGLHASYIFRLVEEFFAPLGVDVVWRNEFTGEHFVNVDGLETLVDVGESAEVWFNTVVLPAVDKVLPQK